MTFIKKISTVAFLILFLFVLNVTVNAEQVTYKNVITDESSIEDDFKILGLNISDYYLTEKHKELEKAYVVGIGESYIENNAIQTYLYIYCPITKEVCSQGISINEIVYSIDGIEDIRETFLKQHKPSTNGLYKQKAFTYNYKQSVEIKVKSINISYLKDKVVDYNGNIVHKVLEFTSTSDFRAKNNHNLANDTFTCELNFNSSLIIEDYNVVRVMVVEDSNFFNNIRMFFDHTVEVLDLYFYNFNFPKHIKPDSIEYAKFDYIKKYYTNFYIPDERDETILGYQCECIGEYTSDNARITFINKNEVTGEYEPLIHYDLDNRHLMVNKHSIEMSFDIVYLGDRYTDGQFDFENKIVEGETSYFDRDCSILLDSTYSTVKVDMIPLKMTTNFAVLDDIELLELHYTKDGVLYKCQVIDTPVDETEIKDVVIKDKIPLWEKLVRWFLDNLPYSLIWCCIFVLIAILIILGLIKFIKNSTTNIISIILLIVFMGIFYIITFPFKLISKIFRKEE